VRVEFWNCPAELSWLPCKVWQSPQLPQVRYGPAAMLYTQQAATSFPPIWSWDWLPAGRLQFLSSPLSRIFRKKCPVSWELAL
jgi:hypothetical protein